MYYIIFPAEDSSWRSDSDTFAEAFLDRWPSARIERRKDMPGLPALGWTLDLTPNVLGYFGGPAGGLGVEGDLDQATEIAVWWRRIVPSSVALNMSDETASRIITVDPDQTAEDLVHEWMTSKRR